MESNLRFYMRRAAEERTAAHRAMTDQARAWHAKLAGEFAERAATCAMPLSSAMPIASAMPMTAACR
jgi:hypothetical protein